MSKIEDFIEILDKRVLVLPDPPEQTYKHVIIPEASLEAQQMGLCVQKGKLVNHELEGKRVVYPKAAGQTIAIDGNNYLIMNADDVFAILKK